MSVTTVYRLGIWLPLARPALTAGIVHGLELRPGSGPLSKIVQILLMSLVYGGVPYLPLAVWGTWWVGGRSEPEIKRLMMRTPLLMAAVFVPTAVVAGIAVGQPLIFIGVAALGAIVIIPLGYAYVGLVVLLREYLGPRPVSPSLTESAP